MPVAVETRVLKFCEYEPGADMITGPARLAKVVKSGVSDTASSARDQ